MIRPSPRTTQGGLHNGGVRMQMGLYSSLPRQMDSSLKYYKTEVQESHPNQGDLQTQFVQHVLAPPEYLIHHPIYPFQNLILHHPSTLSQQELHQPFPTSDIPNIHQALTHQILVHNQDLFLHEQQQQQPGLLMQTRHEQVPHWRSEVILHEPYKSQDMQYPIEDSTENSHLHYLTRSRKQDRKSVDEDPPRHYSLSRKLSMPENNSRLKQPDITDNQVDSHLQVLLQKDNQRGESISIVKHHRENNVTKLLTKSDEEIQQIKARLVQNHSDENKVQTKQPVSETKSLSTLPQLGNGLIDHLGSGLVVPRRRDTWWGRRISRSLEDLNCDLDDLDHLPIDIQDHILTCQCSCNHLGYGNITGSSSLAAKTTTTTCTTNITRNSSTTASISRSNKGSDLQDSDSKHNHKNPTRQSCMSGLSDYRAVTVVVTLVLTMLSVSVGVPLALGRLHPDASPEQRMMAAKSLLEETLFIDGHNDLPWNIRSFMHNKLYSFNFTAELKTLRPWSRSSFSHTDLPRLKEGRVGAQFWVSYVPCASQTLNAVQLTIEQIDLIKRLIDQYSDYLQLATSADEVEEAFKDGKIASLIGVEGGHAIQNSLGVLRSLRDLGVRYLTLTHTCSTPWAESARARETDPENPNVPRGLSYYGKVIVKEMNRLGILVDLSHASQATMRAALETTQAPVLFSHSSVYGICRNPRNVPDDVLIKLKSNGGIVMVSFYNQFLTCSQKATVQHVIDQINYIRNITGIDHVGIGADFDGINLLPDGLEDVSKYPNLFAELLADPNWSTEDLKKLAGQNLLRVMREAEKIHLEHSAKKTQPYEEEPGPSHLKPYNEECFYKFIKDKDE